MFQGTNQHTWDVEPHLPTHRDQPPQPFGLRHAIKAAITLYRPHPPIYYTFWCFLRQDGGIDRIRSVKQSHGCSENFSKKKTIPGLSYYYKKAIKLLAYKNIRNYTKHYTRTLIYCDYNFRILRLVFFSGLSNVRLHKSLFGRFED